MNSKIVKNEKKPFMDLTIGTFDNEFELAHVIDPALAVVLWRQLDFPLSKVQLL
jgi:hypothetical protein